MININIGTCYNILMNEVEQEQQNPMTVRFKKSERETVEYMAKKLGMSYSDFIRLIIRTESPKVFEYFTGETITFDTDK